MKRFSALRIEILGSVQNIELRKEREAQLVKNPTFTYHCHVTNKKVEKEYTERVSTKDDVTIASLKASADLAEAEEVRARKELCQLFEKTLEGRNQNIVPRTYEGCSPLLADAIRAAMTEQNSEDTRRDTANMLLVLLRRFENAVGLLGETEKKKNIDHSAKLLSQAKARAQEQLLRRTAAAAAAAVNPAASQDLLH